MFSSELPFNDIDISEEFIENFPLSFDQFNGINLRLDNDPINNFDIDQFVEYDHDKFFSCEYNYEIPNEFLNSNCFQILFSNIRSFYRNFPYFSSSYFQSGNSFPTILGFCETRIDEFCESIYNFQGYNFVFNSHSSNKGGLLFMIKSEFDYEVIENLNSSTDLIEFLFISISIQNSSFIVDNIYRRPR